MRQGNLLVIKLTLRIYSEVVSHANKTMEQVDLKKMWKGEILQQKKSKAMKRCFNVKIDNLVRSVFVIFLSIRSVNAGLPTKLLATLLSVTHQA